MTLLVTSPSLETWYARYILPPMRSGGYWRPSDGLSSHDRCQTLRRCNLTSLTLENLGETPPFFRLDIRPAPVQTCDIKCVL